MRPIDLLAFRVDDEHKAFLKMVHQTEKNYKIKKQYEAYSWGRSDDFQLGYPHLREEQNRPKKINFSLERAFDNVSIKDIVSADSFSLALSEDGKVYSWGRGSMGRLGHGDEKSLQTPHEINFDFRKDEKMIKDSRRLTI